MDFFCRRLRKWYFFYGGILKIKPVDINLLKNVCECVFVCGVCLNAILPMTIESPETHVSHTQKTLWCNGMANIKSLKSVKCTKTNNANAKVFKGFDIFFGTISLFWGVVFSHHSCNIAISVNAPNEALKPHKLTKSLCSFFIYRTFVWSKAIFTFGRIRSVN